ncbi:MAG: radical SAM protein [Myxococcales bacterium]|nr:radical SAM protein [Myxococcales bacterium]
MHVTLVLTHACNLACSYCYTGEKFDREMTWETAVRGVEMAFAERRPLYPWQQPEATPIDLGFFGGEPLICWEMMERVAVYARDKALREGRVLRLAVTTNGTLVTAERARRLRELEFEVTLSLDGTREAHDATRPQRGGQSSYEAVLRGARHLIEAGHPLEVIAVVAPGNVRQLGASVASLADLGAKQIILNPCYEEPWGDDDLAAWEQGMRDAALVYADAMRAGRVVAMPTFDNKLLAAAKGGLAGCDSCSAGEREVAVSPQGNLYPCARMVGEDRDHRLVIGHLDTGIETPKVKAIPRGPSDPACESCAEKWRCGASCACANLAETGTTNVPGGVQCWYEQASARIADEIGLRLIEERDPTFLQWIYGRVADASAAVRANQEAFQNETPAQQIKRVRRLPVLSAAQASNNGELL